MKRTLLPFSLATLFVVSAVAQTVTNQPSAAPASSALAPFAARLGRSWTSLTNRLSAMSAVRSNLAKSMIVGNRVVQAQPFGGKGTVMSKTVAERGANYRVCQIAVAQTNRAGEVTIRTNSYTELATGMHYQENGQWKETREEILPYPGGAVAQQGPHKVIFAYNLNTAGAVDLQTPDGKRLRSHVLALRYLDAASGKSLLIAQLKDSVGNVVGGNQVLYTDAFTGVKADMRYTYTKAGLEQDVILREQPPAPEALGLNSATTRLQVVTEFVEPPRVTATPSPIPAADGGGTDALLDFGAMQIGPGKAFVLGAEDGDGGVRVAKQWVSVQQRQFLVEEVPLQRLQPQLQTLPRPSGTIQPLGEVLPPDNSWAQRLPRPASGATAVTNAMLLASVSRSEPGVIVDYPITLTSHGNFTFQGDTTYYVSGSVTIGNIATIEGGTVVKFANASNAKIYLGGSVICQTGPYRPAIFTAKDDDSVGEPIEDSTGDPQGHWYCRGLVVGTSGTTLHDWRVSYAVSGVAPNFAEGQISVTNMQFLNCQYPVDTYGYSENTIVLNNSLFSASTYVVRGGSDLIIRGQHLTVSQCDKFHYHVSGASGDLYLTNSIVVAAANGWGNLFYVHERHNGFYDSPTCGNDPIFDIVETDWPFAPHDYSLEGIPNYQGAYYLREGSPFVDAGTADIGAALKAELAQRTTTVPQLFIDDVNSSMTLGPTPIRDTDTPDLGYHYAAVDYVLTYATVNNATLNIDQGTALAFIDPMWFEEFGTWGLRLNPGGRLNVNGAPTNRVTFARLESVQENPQWWFHYWGAPLITFKGITIHHDTSYNIVTPLAEAKLQYADFPTIAGNNAHMWPMMNPVFEPYTDVTYDLVSNLEIDGCHFQGGYLGYDDGGPSGRALRIRNSVFERCAVIIGDRGYSEASYHGDPYSALVNVANNLFYQCLVNLRPVSGANAGASWTFTDNIFDHVCFDNVAFGEPPVGIANGPVGANNHNAYVGMAGIPNGGNRLSPAAPTNTDPDLTSLGYVTGALGQFYLPTVATALIDTGSQTAANAGLYHFTSSTSNAKEATSQVNIGPHYVALVNGAPADTDSDGFPDYQEDSNGDGIAQDSEPNWQAAPAVPIRILGTFTTVSGLTQIPVEFDNSAGGVVGVSLIDESGGVLPAIPLMPPFSGPLKIDLDTRSLPNGSLTFKAQALVAAYGSATPYSTVTSDPVTVTVDNALRYPDWNSWTGDTDAVFNFDRSGGAFSYVISVFDSDYPVSYDPQPCTTLPGTTADGHVSHRWTLGAYEDGRWHPGFYTVLTASPSTLLPNTGQGIAFPDVGHWYVAYEDSFRRMYLADGSARPVRDPLQPYSNYTWFHDGALQGWLGVSAWFNPPALPAPNHYNPPPYPDDHTVARTWPIRYCSYAPSKLVFAKGVLSDWTLFANWVSDPEVRNLYIGCHMSKYGIGILPADRLPDLIRQRYHFVFLDGCESAYLLSYFHFDQDEAGHGVELDHYSTPPSKVTRNRPAGAVAAPFSFGVVIMTPSDPDYIGYIPEEVSQFYMNFQAKWTLEMKGLQQALGEAGIIAASTHVPLVEPPWENLGTFGFYNLRHNQYNVRSSWVE